MTTAMLATRPLTPRQYEQRRREFYEATAPLTRIMTDILAIQPFRLTMTPGTLPEREILWLPGSKESYDRCQEMIGEYGRMYGIGANTP